MAAATAAVLLLLLLVDQARTLAAAPLKPDFTLCGNYFGTDINCCTLPELTRGGSSLREGAPSEFMEWEEYLRENPLPKRLRIRRAAHLPEVAANATYLEQLDRAYRLVRSLPPSDPRSLLQQNNFHCMYGGTGVERQLGHPDLDFSIHVNWLFFPWHRWYVNCSSYCLIVVIIGHTKLASGVLQLWRAFLVFVLFVSRFVDSASGFTLECL